MTTSAPSTTDWISAAAAVVQTVGAILAIFVTAVIARRSERDAARREQESVKREAAARLEADARAEQAIERAAAAEQGRLEDARRRVCTIALQGIDSVLDSFDMQIEAISPARSRNIYGDLQTANLNWVAAEAALITFRALAQRTDDHVVATLLEQGAETLKRPGNLGNWDPDAARRQLESRVEELQILREALATA